MIEQMTLDGGTIEYARATKLPRLTDDQRTLLRLLETRPVVTVVMVGRAIHAAHGSSCVTRERVDTSSDPTVTGYRVWLEGESGWFREDDLRPAA